MIILREQKRVLERKREVVDEETTPSACTRASEILASDPLPDIVSVSPGRPLVGHADVEVAVECECECESWTSSELHTCFGTQNPEADYSSRSRWQLSLPQDDGMSTVLSYCSVG